MILTAKQLEKAREYICKCIAQAAPSDRLPSLRTMMGESHCSRMALQRVIGEYVRSGHVFRKPKSGYYLNSVLPVGRTVEMVACHDEGYLTQGAFLDECVLAMINTFGNYGYSVKLTSVRNTDSVEKYLEVAGRRDSSAFVLLMPRAREIVSAFQLTGKPVLVLFPQGRFVNVNQLVDSPHLVELQFNHLYELGHRQILYLQDCWQSQSRTQAGRVLDYYRLMSRNGIPVPSHWQTDYRNGALCDVLAQAFSRQPWPTGLIVSDSAVSAVYDFLRRRNLVIGRDVSVVATDGVSFLEPLSPSVSTTVMNGVHISDMAWKLLNKQFKGDKGFECKEVEIEFKQGGSSGRKQ